MTSIPIHSRQAARGAPHRRAILGGALALGAAPGLAVADPTAGEKLAAAARRQLGVTTGYDPAYVRLAYPGGDVARASGVCADVVVRAARDGLGLDLQRLVHEDMARAFAAYPSKAAWGLARPDRNIDHRRVLNLETFWTRQGGRLWRADGAAPGAFAGRPLRPGDFLTWRLGGRLPHVAVVVAGGVLPRIVHNIGGGAEELGLAAMAAHRAVGHYRWSGDVNGVLKLRPATVADAALLAEWDREPHVIACCTDDADAEIAFDADWAEEIAASSDVSYYLIAELDGRPIGAMQVIDPRLEPTHYWDEIEPGLRALDIWIGPPELLGKGLGAAMMTRVIDDCFADPSVHGIVIDPLNSNTGAHRFYRRLGFEAVGRRTFGEDDCLVHRLTRADWEARS